ncbi:MAG: hypothetical protein Q7T61_13525 [Caulobacter sp.]|nr:hypothetical protein [Caulobacter sp.]
MNAEDILDLVGNLLTLVAIFMVVAEKAAPSKNGTRIEQLRRFVDFSVFASPGRIRSRAALMMARFLSGRWIKPSKRVGALLGYILIPLVVLPKSVKFPAIPAIFVAFGLEVFFAAKGNSIFVILTPIALALFVLVLLYLIPIIHLFFFSEGQSTGYFDEKIHFRRGPDEYGILTPKSKLAKLTISIIKVAHPHIAVDNGRIGVKLGSIRYMMLGIAFAAALLFTVPLLFIDGFIMSPWPVQIALAVTVLGLQIGILLTPILVINSSIEPLLAPNRPPREIAWGATHVMRAFGPTAIVSALVCTLFVTLTPELRSRGGAWLFFVVFTADVWLSIATGFFLRNVIRHRGDLIQTIQAVGWIAFLFLVSGGLKLFVATAFSPLSMSIIEAYRFSTGYCAFTGTCVFSFPYFALSQLASCYWLIYVVLMFFMFSLSFVASVIKRTLGVAVRTLSPLEILATYLTVVVAILALWKSGLKLFT